MQHRRSILVIGIGNPARGDDAVGRLVAQRLREHGVPGVEIRESDGEVGELVDMLSGESAAFLVDAGAFGAAPGTLRRLDAGRERIPASAVGPSTHGLGLAQAVELARALGRLPQNCVVYVIQGRDYDVGAALSQEVAAAVPEAAAMILLELAELRPEASQCMKPI